MAEKLSNLDSVTQQVVVVKRGSKPHSLVLEPTLLLRYLRVNLQYALPGWAVRSTAPGAYSKHSINSSSHEGYYLKRPMCSHEVPLLDALTSLRTCGQVHWRKEALTFYPELHT